ncbi:hypothetical protein E3V08_06070 [Candidatus Atribacteria bacterium MT.SAG.1]|nr:hypothetical protein E3V08_06070 [Candidatus Atribacteria bacterium MT.SAG.1]
MQITRVEAKVRKSRITGGDVDRLPKVLRWKTVKLLNQLEGVKQISIKGKTQDAIFELSDQNVTLDFFDRKLRKEFVKTIDLLKWYQGSHWQSEPGLVGGPVYCTHCFHTRPPGSFSKHCPNSRCPSHEKWYQINGPSYRPQEDSVILL